MILFIISTFLLVALAIIFHAAYNRYQLFTRQNILHTRPSFPFGNTKSSILKRRNIVYDVDDVYKSFKGKAQVAGFFASFSPYILIMEPELIKACRNFRNNDFVVDEKRNPIIAKNTFFLKDDVWKEKRREIDSALTGAKVKSMYAMIAQGAKRWVDFINQEIHNDPSKTFTARDITSRYTCDVISNCLFGFDADSFTNKKSPIFHFGHKFIRGIMDSLISVLPRTMLSDDVVQFFTNMAKEAINFRLENKIPKIQRDDMLAQIIALQQAKGLDDLDVLGHCMTLFLDSFETSAITIQNALYYLAKDKRIQSKLRVEIIKSVDEGGFLSYDEVSELLYLDQVFYETLRLHPGLVFTTRVCSEDFEVVEPGQGTIVIKKNSSLWIPIHSIQRDPEHFTNPEEFFPERFDEQHGGVKAFQDRCVLLPFGDGVRRCSGMKFATAIVKTAIAAIVRNFEISVDEKSPQRLIVSPNEFMNIPDKAVYFAFKPIQ